MLKDKQGNRLFRKVVVKIIFPENLFPTKTMVQHAGPHQGFSEDGIDGILMSYADRLEQLYPYWDFKLTELKPEGRTARYVMQFAGYRAVAQPPTVIEEFTETPKPQSSSTLEPETLGSITPVEAKSEAGATLEQPVSQEAAL